MVLLESRQHVCKYFKTSLLALKNALHLLKASWILISCLDCNISFSTYIEAISANEAIAASVPLVNRSQCWANMSRDEFFLRIEEGSKRRFGRLHTPSRKGNHRSGPQDLHSEIRRERHYTEQVSFHNEANAEWIRFRTYANITSQVARRLQINPMIESIPNLRYLSLVLRHCCNFSARTLSCCFLPK